MHVIQKPMVYYDKTYLYTPNEHQDKIQDLRNIRRQGITVQGDGIMGSFGNLASEKFILKGIPYFTKTTAEAGWYYASERQ